LIIFNNINKKLKKIIIIICLSIIFVSSIVLVKILLIDPKTSENKIQKARDVYENEEHDVYDKNVSEKLAPLAEANSDIKGWLKIENTPIDYPVVQSSSENPLFYLNRNYLKQKDVNGSIFINAFMPFGKNIQNVVLHGHSMRNGTMFAALLKFHDINVYKKSHIINFDTILGTGKWKIFAVFKTNTLEKHGKIFNYLLPTFNSEKDFFEFIYKIRIRSMLDIPVDITKNDKILTLSTCSYEMPEFRTVVAARKLRRAESEKINLDAVKTVQNPLMPEAWCKTRGRKVPEFPSFEDALKNGDINWIK
jgi:sortase B